MVTEDDKNVIAEVCREDAAERNGYRSIERAFDYVGNQHFPTVKVTMNPCHPDDNNAWNNRDSLGRDIGAYLNGEQSAISLRQQLADVSHELDLSRAACDQMECGLHNIIVSKGKNVSELKLIAKKKLNAANAMTSGAKS